MSGITPDPCTGFPGQECIKACETFCRRFEWKKPHAIFNGTKVMPNRMCEVWAVHKKRRYRFLHWLRYGHAKHQCNRYRAFAQEHRGWHQCLCGFEWPKQSTDND